MPNSLKCKIKHLRHNGTLTERECDRILKALEQQPKAGKWLIAPDEEPGYDIAGIKTWYKIATCSKCGFIKPMIEYHISQYKYCPNCGAKMKEDIDEDSN